MNSILLIDDDVQVLDVIGWSFARRGWVVVRAGDGAAGIATYLREQPDLVLLDLGLPDRPGLDVLRALREQDPDATILVLASNTDIAAAVSAFRLGAEDFLTKPIELTHLEAATERALEKAALRRRSAGAAAPDRDVDLTLAEVERRHIHRVLVHHAGNRSRAARTLGISRATLYEKIRRYGLEASGRRSPG